MIDSLLLTTIKVTIKDSRTFTGKLLCTDDGVNLILSDTIEERKGIRRSIGTCIIPGKEIASIHKLHSNVEAKD